MKIRRATKKDIEKIYPLYLEYMAAEDACAKKLGLKKTRLRKNSKQAISQKILDIIRDDYFLVAEEKGELLGFCSGLIKPKKDIFTAKQGQIGRLCVGKEHRRKGIGGKLMTAVERWLKQKGCVIISLNVISSNPAEKLYLKKGYMVEAHHMVKEL